MYEAAMRGYLVVNDVTMTASIEVMTVRATEDEMKALLEVEL